MTSGIYGRPKEIIEFIKSDEFKNKPSYISDMEYLVCNLIISGKKQSEVSIIINRSTARAGQIFYRACAKINKRIGPFQNGDYEPRNYGNWDSWKDQKL